MVIVIAKNCHLIAIPGKLLRKNVRVTTAYFALLHEKRINTRTNAFIPAKS